MTSPADFPSLTYQDWLLSHSDEQLSGLLWRLHQEEDPFTARAFADSPGFGSSARGASPLGASALGSSARGTSSLSSSALGSRSQPVSSLFSPHLLDGQGVHQLSAIELLVLHAGLEMDATRQWVTVGEILSTTDELLDIAGTVAGWRPEKTQVIEAIGECSRWGLLFGEAWTLDGAAVEVTANTAATTDTAATETTADTLLKLPPHLATMFQPSTEHLWRLADCNRCPIPTAELADTVESLPARERRLLETLNHGGGVGHSASLAPGSDPDKPLPKLVHSGILDQLDETTARLSGRVGEYLRGTVIAEPGGDFRPPRRDNPAPAEQPEERITTTAVANIIQTIQDLTDLLEYLGEEPIQPLAAGGIGVREMNKVARRLDTTAEDIERRLTLCHETGLIARDVPYPAAHGDSAMWAPTELALDFLERGLPEQWAALLIVWLTSPYAPWCAEEVEARLFEDALDSDAGAGLRRIFPFLFRTPAHSISEIPQALWRLRPHEAWRTRGEAVETVVEESVALGLTALEMPAAALFALREYATQVRGGDGSTGSAEAREDLVEALRQLLPKPVKMLLIQGDHTIMAPGLLEPEHAAQLRRMAIQESSGMASVWRVTKESLLEAFKHGDSPEGLVDFLTSMSPGEIPQSLVYLIKDTHRGSAMATAGTATSYIAADSEATIDHILTLPNIEGLHLKKIAPTVLTSTAQLSHLTDTLDVMGVGLSLDGGSMKATAPTTHRVPTPDMGPTPADVRQSIDGVIESFRRAQDLAADGTHTHDGDAISYREPHDMMAALTEAYRSGNQARVSYVNAAGSTINEWVSVIMMNPTAIVAVTEAEGDKLNIQPHRLVAVEVPQ